jgi:hypothetical protein
LRGAENRQGGGFSSRLGCALGTASSQLFVSLLSAWFHILNHMASRCAARPRYRRRFAAFCLVLVDANVHAGGGPLEIDHAHHMCSGLDAGLAQAIGHFGPSPADRR